MNNIIITGPFSRNGGVAQFISNLLPFFGKETILFRRGKRKSFEIFGFLFPFIDIFRYIGFVLINRPSKILINSSLAKVGIVRDGIFILVSKALGIKTVLFIHGFNEQELNLGVLIKMGYFKADKIFVLSSIFKNQLIKLGYEKPIIVTFNPIGIDLIESYKRTENKIQKNDLIKILMLSRIEKSKGIFIGLDVLKALQEYNIELHIAGLGSELEEAKKFVKDNKLKKVKFYGFISGIDKENLLRNCDILLFPTFHNEGLPINVLESLAMGLSVITRPVAGINDLKNRYHFFLVDSKVSLQYEKIILQLLKFGLPKTDIYENQLRASIDFSPNTIYNKVVLES